MTTSSLRVIITGFIGHQRLLGGVAWDYLNVVLGMKRLGHDVYYIEDSGCWPYNDIDGPSGGDWTDWNLQPLSSISTSSCQLSTLIKNGPISFRLSLNGLGFRV